MAHIAKAISLLFLVGLFLSISLKVEARESKHFSKVTHGHHRQPQVAPELAPSPSPAPAPAPGEETIQPPMTGNGYGLFGHHESSQRFPPSTTTTTSATAATISGDNENEFRGEELSQNYKEETSNPYYNNNNYNTNGYYTTKYNYNGNYRAGERQGMSDTRYLENGKFYDNTMSENNNNNNKNNNYHSHGNGYQQPAVERGSRRSNNGGYFGKTQYEFDSMEEYERQQGYYPQTQGEFVP